MALLIITATGFRSWAWASSPSRCASSGIAPPPAKGSSSVIFSSPQDLRLGTVQDLRVVGVLPDHQLLQDFEQPLPLRVLLLLGGEALRMGGGIVHQRGPDHSPSRRQRPPRPPKVQRGRMPMPDRLLPRRLRIDFLQRKRHLNYFLFHFLSFTPIISIKKNQQ